MNSILLSGKIIGDSPYCRRIVWTPGGSVRLSLDYRLKRSPSSRKLTVRCDARGVTAVAPSWVSVKRVDRFIFEQRMWIIKESRAYSERSELRDGKLFPYRGGEAVLRFGCDKEGMVFSEGRCEMHLRVPKDAPFEKAAPAFERVMRKEARRIIGESVERVLPRAARKPVLWRLSGAKGRWGSCNSRKGYINLSWRLAGVDDSMIDYVVAHELAHLIEANHSASFWKEVEKIDPEYREKVEAFKKIRSDLFPGI